MVPPGFEDDVLRDVGAWQNDERFPVPQTSVIQPLKSLVASVIELRPVHHEGRVQYVSMPFNGHARVPGHHTETRNPPRPGSVVYNSHRHAGAGNEPTVFPASNWIDSQC